MADPLQRLLSGPVLHGLEQAAFVSLLVLAVTALARTQAIRLGGETAVALLRGFVQIVVVGLVLLPLLGGAPGWGVLLLAGMIAAAALTTARRAKGMPGGLATAFCGIGFGSGVTLAVALATGLMEMKTASMVAVGSMIIANAMNTASQTLERFRSDVIGHTAPIETALALGAEPGRTVEPYVRDAVIAGLIPRIDTLRSLGIVWIPGVMAGMVLSGSDPVYAAIYQFVVLALIYAAAGLTALAIATLVRPRVFTAAGQLILRP